MKLKRLEKQTLLSIGIGAYASGAALFIFSKWIRVASEVGEQRHPLEHWIRSAHTALTYFIVVAFGYLIAEHIIPGLKSKQKKRLWSGLGNVGLFFVLTFTALVVLYGSDGLWTTTMSWTHSVTGLLCPGFIFFHVFRKKGKR